MDALQFLAAVINSLAWPLTTVALVFVLREPVGRVLTTLTRLKYKDLELDFGRELKQIEEKAKAIEVLPAPTAKAVGGPKEPHELLEEAERLAPEFPEPAVAVAWSAIEDGLWQAKPWNALRTQPHFEASLRRKLFRCCYNVRQ